MPSDFDKKLSAEDFGNLLAFLSRQGGAPCIRLASSCVTSKVRVIGAGLYGHGLDASGYKRIRE